MKCINSCQILRFVAFTYFIAISIAYPLYRLQILKIMKLAEATEYFFFPFVYAGSVFSSFDLG